MPLDESRPRRPFRAAAAYRSGVQRSELLGSDYRRVLHGVYVRAPADEDDRLRAAAILVPHPPDAYASHFTAARLWDLPVPANPGEDVTVSHPNDRRRRAQVRVHVSAQDSSPLELGGLRVSAPTRVFTELAGVIPLVDAVALGDCAVRRQLCSLAELQVAAARTNRAARRAASYVREGVDSPMESRLRMLIVLAGLPEPRTNLKLRAHDGEIIVQFDLAYERYKLAVQYDGRAHDAETQRDHDLHRREFLDHLGWRLVVVNSRGIYVAPKQTLDRVRLGLADQGATGLRRTFTPGWRQHFPGRN